MFSASETLRTLQSLTTKLLPFATCQSPKNWAPQTLPGVFRLAAEFSCVYYSELPFLTLKTFYSG